MKAAQVLTCKNVIDKTVQMRYDNCAAGEPAWIEKLADKLMWIEIRLL